MAGHTRHQHAWRDVSKTSDQVRGTSNGRRRCSVAEGTATLQELYAPTWRERICRTLNPETMQFESSLTDIWADYHRGRVERWFERDWENGNYDGVLDFIAIRGPVALERDWVHAAITAARNRSTRRRG